MPMILIQIAIAIALYQYPVAAIIIGSSLLIIQVLVKAKAK
jgi:hypothetical protein